jgi:hypothetical protein
MRLVYPCTYGRFFTHKSPFYFTMALFMLLISCSTTSKQPSFDPKTCLENIPKNVKGLKIVSGPRTEKNIIRDMVSPICSAYALFRHLKSKDHEINDGHVVFRVIVEYTGEVAYAGIEETTIQSEYFLREVRDFIMDTDFVLWGGDDRDTIFLYPVKFNL